jgi:hypothetical protein
VMSVATMAFVTRTAARSTRTESASTTTTDPA